MMLSSSKTAMTMVIQPAATSEQAAVERPNANAAPRFLDKGPVSRSVAENVKDAGVGDPGIGQQTATR